MSQVVTKYLGLRVPYYRSVDWYDDMVYSFKIIDDVARVYHHTTQTGGSSIVYSILSNGQRIPAITIGSEGENPVVSIEGLKVSGNTVEVKTGEVPSHETEPDVGKYLLITDGSGDQWVAPLYKRT
jgi:hypothetical protein